MAPSGSLGQETERAIERFLDDRLAAADVPGASVAVFDDDGILFATGLGTRSLETNAPATARTLHYVGSITKVVTAICVFQQIERGALALSDPVADHVEWVTDAPGEPVTVEELLRHASGLPSDAIAYRDGIADDRDFELHVAGALDRRVLDDPPRMYYNSGYKLLGQVVAAVADGHYTEYAEREVLAPLGMERSTFDGGVLESDDDATAGHRREDGNAVPGVPLEFEETPAAGGLISSVEELSRLSRAVLGDGSVEGGRVLPPETTARLRADRRDWHEWVDGSRRGYGRGLMFADHLEDEVVGHAGTVESSLANLGQFRDRDLGVAAAFTAPGLDQMAVGRGLLAVAAGEAPTVVPELGLERQFDAVTGTYENYRGGPDAVVEADDGHLTIRVGDEMTFPAIPLSADPDGRTYRAVHEGGLRVPVEFRETDEGLTMLWRRWRFDRNSD